MRICAIVDPGNGRLEYVVGSGHAIDTLLAGEGVCRDLAHVCAVLSRIVDVPARFTLRRHRRRAAR